MNLARTICVLPILSMLVACGGASLVLKSPVQDQCNKAGLQGCPDVVGGVLVYIDGDKANGKDQMLRGAAQNAPEKVKAFAQAVRTLPLDKIPGAQRFTSVVMEVADILAGAPAGAAPGGPPAPGGPVVVVQGATGVGYELFYNGRRVNGPDAAGYTLEQGVKNCVAMQAQHPDRRVTCTFNGTDISAPK